MTIPTEVIMRMATIGLSEEQARAVADMLTAVEAATKQDADAIIEHGRAKARERVQRWRDGRARNVTKRSATSPGVTEPLTSGDAPVEDKTLPSVIEPQVKKEGKVRACRLPTDFAPDVSWAASQGLTPSQAETEAAKFRDYWSSKGSNATKTDWPATWRNWVRSAVERTPHSRAPPASQQAPSMSDLLVAIRDTPHENQPRPPEDRSGLRPAIPHLRTVGTG